MPLDPHRTVLRKPQQALWKDIQQDAAMIHGQGFYLAGGTALALQLKHRESNDFDFFSQTRDIEPIRAWLQHFSGLVVREEDPETVHAEISGVKVSFIGGYRYPLVKPTVVVDSVATADIIDIGLMKMLAVTHRATLRDYIDLAVILRDRCSLKELIAKSTEKYGTTFNPMLALRAMVHFDDLDDEMPVLLDATLGRSWKDILRKAVKDSAV